MSDTEGHFEVIAGAPATISNPNLQVAVKLFCMTISPIQDNWRFVYYIWLQHDHLQAFNSTQQCTIQKRVMGFRIVTKKAEKQPCHIHIHSRRCMSSLGAILLKLHAVVKLSKPRSCVLAAHAVGLRVCVCVCVCVWRFFPEESGKLSGPVAIIAFPSTSLISYPAVTLAWGGRRKRRRKVW